IVVAYLLFTYVEAKTMEFDLQQSTGGRNNRKLLELCAALILLTGFIFAFEPFAPINVSVLIALIVLVFAYIWSIYLRTTTSFVREINEYRKSIFPNKANEINLLLTAGLFGVVLAKTPVSNVINFVWGSLANVSVFVLILATII